MRCRGASKDLTPASRSSGDGLVEVIILLEPIYSESCPSDAGSPIQGRERKKIKENQIPCIATSRASRRRHYNDTSHPFPTAGACPPACRSHPDRCMLSCTIRPLPLPALRRRRRRQDKGYYCRKEIPTKSPPSGRDRSRPLLVAAIVCSLPVSMPYPAHPTLHAAEHPDDQEPHGTEELERRQARH